MSFLEGLPPSLDLLGSAEYESGTPLLGEPVAHADSDSESVRFTDSMDSDSSIQDMNETEPVAQWEKFDILNILIAQEAIDRGFNRKLGGFYRRVQGEKKNNQPVWRNRFSYEISKLDSKATCFDVSMPNMKSVLRIEETTYRIWVLSGEKFHLVQDDSIQFFFEYVDEAEAQLDHFIETYFKEEAKVTRLQPSFASPTPRSPNNLKWSTKNLFNFGKNNERARGRSVDSGLYGGGKINSLRINNIQSSSLDLSDAAAVSSEPYDFSRQYSEPIKPKNFDASRIDERLFTQKKLLFSEDDMWLHLPRRPSLQRTTSKETKEAIKKRRGQRTFVNQYMIDKTLATTGLGVVKLATDIIRKEKVVLKIFERSLLNKRNRLFRPGRRKLLGTKKRKQERSIMDNIMREMEIMKNLRHPNIVSALETIDDTESDQIFLVLEYVDGGTLTDYLSEPEEDINLVRSFARDLLHGIAYLHEKRIIHGDIKPDNIFIKSMPNGRKVLKIGDFGVSKCMDDYNSFMSKIETTPAYQAPEEFGGANFKAWPRDIWSVGIVLYQLAFGIHPIMPEKNSALHAVFEAIQNTTITFPEGCDEPLKDLLGKMLKKDPSERITIEDIQVHDFITENGKFGWTDELTYFLPRAPSGISLHSSCSYFGRTFSADSFRLQYETQPMPVIVIEDADVDASNLDQDDNRSHDSSIADLLPVRGKRTEELMQRTKQELVDYVLELEARLLLHDSKE